MAAPLLVASAVWITIAVVNTGSPAVPLQTPCVQPEVRTVERLLDVDVTGSEGGGSGRSSDASWLVGDEVVVRVSCDGLTVEDASRAATDIVEQRDLDGQPAVRVLRSEDGFPTRLLLVYRQARVTIEVARELDPAASRELVDAWVSRVEAVCSDPPSLMLDVCR